MIADKIPALQALSTQEKFILANELWDEVEKNQNDIPFNEATLKLLEERFAAFGEDPSTAVTWEQFKRRLAKS